MASPGDAGTVALFRLRSTEPLWVSAHSGNDQLTQGRSALGCSVMTRKGNESRSGTNQAPSSQRLRNPPLTTRLQPTGLTPLFEAQSLVWRAA
jgi:hypothetical protein